MEILRLSLLSNHAETDEAATLLRAVYINIRNDLDPCKTAERELCILQALEEATKKNDPL